MSTELKDKDIELPQDTKGENCSNCKFWFELRESEPNSGLPRFGKCKKNPPALLVQDEKTYSGHPITSESDWCGSWELGFRPSKNTEESNTVEVVEETNTENVIDETNNN